MLAFFVQDICHLVIAILSFQGESDTGSDDDIQIDSVTRIAPIVALYAGKEDMLSKVEEMVRVTQNNDVPVAYALAAARVCPTTSLILCIIHHDMPTWDIGASHPHCL